jgi:uncharacterized membrane protein YfcA
MLYSAVGHAGASGYLAAMAFFGVSPIIMKPTALVLNILVASITTFRYCRAGCFSWNIFWPFMLTSIPAAFLGGTANLPVGLFNGIVAFVLLIAALRLFLKMESESEESRFATSNIPLALLIGSGIGGLSGLTGTGGGIFLSPILILTGWSTTRQASGISAAFILVNSVAGLWGCLTKWIVLPSILPLWGVFVIGGALLGTRLGIRQLSVRRLRLILGIVLTLAGLKLILTSI